MKVGDIVKSLDFVGDESCYMIGEVVSINEFWNTFKARTISVVWFEEEMEELFSEYFQAPLQGTGYQDNEYDTPRVTVIG